MADVGAIHGTLAAAVTPLTTAGAAIDERGIESLVDFYARSSLDGLLAMGTTGEGILLSTAERRIAAERFLKSADGRLAVAVHCGAQTTRDTAELAAHAAEHGAAGVAVIPPPYYALDEESILRHLMAAANACAPVPFYVYEFAARSGYPVPLSVVRRLREGAPNLAGMKVSDSPFASVEPYLTLGLDVFIGAEGLIHLALRHGARGAVSALAAALPELAINAVRIGSAEASERARRARHSLQGLPFQAALKAILRERGVSIEEAVRGPLRGLDAAERVELHRAMADPGGEIAPLLRG
ncbi:MAG TPA: dihydrodipicolinate synthase family protein [Candidatus Binatia bacterium]|nr:dihydrodipicolinate synthase family protein [Candidatus Binatia bacterium]